MSVFHSLRLSIASAGLAAAAVSSTAGAAAAPSPEERESKPRAGASLNADLPARLIKPGAPADTSAAAKQVPEEERQTRCQALASDIMRPETCLAALEHLSPSDLGEREVTESVLAALGKAPTTISTNCADLLLQSDFFMCHALSLSPQELAAKHEHLWLNIVKSATTEEVSRVTPMLTDVFVALFAEHASLKAPNTALEMTPNQIRRRNPALQKAFGENFDLSSAPASVLRFAMQLGASNDVLFPRVHELEAQSLPWHEEDMMLKEMLISTLTPAALERYPESHRRILRQLREQPRDWPESDVMKSDPFRNLIVEEITRDPKFASRVPPALYETESPQFSREIRAAIEEAIESAGNSLPYRRLADIPALALEDPETRQIIRELVNDCIDSSSRLEKLSSIPHPEPFVRHIPEVLRLAFAADSFDAFSPAVLASLPTISPRGFGRVLDSGVAPKRDWMISLANTLAAFDAFGIQGVSRFDNGREILRNRYAIADESTKTAVRGLLPEGFFDGVEEDTRPFAICVICDPSADYDNTLAKINSGRAQLDYIDRLTDHYRVLLFEASSGKDLCHSLAEAHNQHGVTAEVLIVIGHGSQDSISLGDDRVEPTRGGLFSDDPALAGLVGLMQRHGHIALVSCSTASDSDPDSTSMFESFRGHFPDCYISAPREPIGCPKMYLSRRGEFQSMKYDDARSVLLDPTTGEVSEVYDASTRPQTTGVASSWTEGAWSYISWGMTLWPVYLGAGLFGLGRAVARHGGGQRVDSERGRNTGKA